MLFDVFHFNDESTSLQIHFIFLCVINTVNILMYLYCRLKIYNTLYHEAVKTVVYLLIERIIPYSIFTNLCKPR